MRNRHVLLWLTIILAVLSAIPTFFRLGPVAEASLMPVIEMRGVGQRASVSQFDPLFVSSERSTPEPVEVRRSIVNGEEVDQLLFKTDSFKSRACPLELASWRWYLDHQAEPAILFFDDNKGPDGEDEQFVFGTALLSGAHLSRPLRAEIPREAYSFNEVWLVGNFFYRCHALWPLPAEIRIRVTMPGRDSNALPTAEADDDRAIAEAIRELIGTGPQ